MAKQSGLTSHLAILALVLGAAACGQTATTSSATTETTTPPPVAAPPLAPTATAPDFVQKVAFSDMYEIQASRMAVRRAQNTGIRTFAQQMVHDHTATSAELTHLIHGQDGLAIPTALDADHQTMIDNLTHASVADFDQIYVDQQTHAHEDALHLLEDYGQHGDNEGLRGFATETAPKVQHHLDMVRALDRSGADEPNATTTGTSTTHP